MPIINQTNQRVGACFKGGHTQRAKNRNTKDSQGILDLFLAPLEAKCWLLPTSTTDCWLLPNGEKWLM